MRTYVVKQFAHVLDTNPTLSEIMSESEAVDLAGEWIEEAVSLVVQHSPYSISEKELEEIRELESTLVQVEEV